MTNINAKVKKRNKLLINKIMPITKNIAKNFHELYEDNKKKGKARGANGKPRSRKQIIAIALSKSKKKR